MSRLAIRPSIAVTGALIGVAVIVTVRLLLSSLWPLLPGYALIVLVGYLIGAATMGRTMGELSRGLLIGTNAAMNGVLAAAAFSSILGNTAGIAVGIGLGVVTGASTFGVLSRSSVYQGLLGYLNWLLPLSWPIVALGLTMLLLCFLGAVTLGRLGVEYFRITRVAFDARTGTLFIRGGWISNLNPIDTAFNMGNFAFVDCKHYDMAMDHESGHTLNLAAFGTVFHLLGALDENVVNGESAFSERLAESYVANSTRPLIGMWA